MVPSSTGGRMRRPACQQELHKGRDEVYWQRTGAAQLAENTCLPICFQPGQELWCCKGWRKRHPHAAGCSGAPPFGLSTSRAFPLGSVEEKQGFLGYQVIVSVLDLYPKVRWRASWKCVAAVQKVSLDSWLRGYDL